MGNAQAQAPGANIVAEPGENILAEPGANIDQMILADEKAVSLLTNIDLERASYPKLVKTLMAVTREIDNRVNVMADDQNAQLLRLITSGARTQAEALERLQQAGQALRINPREIRDASLQNPRMIRRLWNSIKSAFGSMVSSVRSNITFTNIADVAVSFRYGFTPRLIRALYSNSGLGMIGIANGMLCIGLIGRFLYINPEILKIVEVFYTSKKTGNAYQDIINLVNATAIYGAIRDQLAIMLERGLLGGLKADVELFGPFLLTSMDYVGWSAHILRYALHHNVVDLSATFVDWLERKTMIFSHVTKVFSFIQKGADIVKHGYTKLSEVPTILQDKVQKGVGKVYSFIVDKDKRDAVIEHTKEMINSVDFSDPIGTSGRILDSIKGGAGELVSSAWAWFLDKADKAEIEMESTADRLEHTADRLEKTAQRVQESQQLASTPSVAGLSYTSPGASLLGGVGAAALPFTGKRVTKQRISD
jgi:hypothetical protein